MRRFILATVLTVLVPGSVLAQTEASPTEISPVGARLPGPGLQAIPFVELPDVDLVRAQAADEMRLLKNEVAHFAMPLEVELTPLGDGPWAEAWDRVERDTKFRWRVQLRSPGALSLNLAFGAFRMPEGGELIVRAADGSEEARFTAADNEEHGQLWTPPFMTDHLVLELRLPADLVDDPSLLGEFEDFELRLDRVHHGYSGFGAAAPLSGSCQRDVVCSDSPGWRDAARSVALISVGGVRFCTGFMVNNTAFDGTPYFITAHHCGVTPKNAASVVVMWNYQSPLCRDEGEAAEPPRPSRHFQTGAVLRASWKPTDVTLLLLDDPPRPEWSVRYAGWDRSGDVPVGTTVIHHPNTDAQRISFDQDPPQATFYLVEEIDGAGDHLRVGSWESGSTEGGSSGAPLFDADQRVVGQLHGGYAECGAKTADWFGRFAVSWEGGGKPTNRLADWLDPRGSEELFIDGEDATAPIGVE